MELLRQKGKQACEVLADLGIDLWLIFVRETKMMADPAIAMVVGEHATWPSFFAFTAKGESFALVGNFDEENFRRSGCFTETASYTHGIKKDFIGLIERLAPKSIALNFSADNVAADGLTHGMFLQLQEFLKGTPYAGRLLSSEELISKLRSRKLPEEVDRIGMAAEVANTIWEESCHRIKAGMTELEIAALLEGEMQARGLRPSFETIVNAGSKSEPGHGLPSEAVLEPGDLLHVDFGVIHNGYCSDLQRLAYLRKSSEHEPPDELVNAFNMVFDIITETGSGCTPGTKGFELDKIARDMLVAAGYPEYQHALGHQLGRDVHDGGGILGPQWERYGSAPAIPIELNNIFTLELEIILPEIGCVGLEEDIVVTENGAEFLCPRQQELVVL